jgi:hypothetical protein
VPGPWRTFSAGTSDVTWGALLLWAAPATAGSRLIRSDNSKNSTASFMVGLLRISILFISILP